MSVILEHAELSRRILSELGFEEWATTLHAGRVAALAAQSNEKSIQRKIEVSLKATCEAYREALRRKESK